MNVIDKLMGFDRGEIKAPTKDFAMKLARLGGEEFVFPIRALSSSEDSSIKEGLYDMTGQKNGVKMKLNTTKARHLTLVYGCEIFKDEALRNHFGVNTPHELIDFLLLPGEQEALESEIGKLTGYETDEEDIEEIKN